MDNKVIVVGIGPGSPDYVIPAAMKVIAEAKVIVGGRRALAAFASTQAETFTIGSDIKGVLTFIESRLAISDVVVLVSGDPGYYSLLAAIKGRFPGPQIKVIPGLSSLQVAFARLAEPWQDAELLSLHGRSIEPYRLKYELGRKLGLLTDSVTTPIAAAKLLLSHGWPDKTQAAVCCNLSYDNELIIRTTLAELANYYKESEKIMATSVMVVLG